MTKSIRATITDPEIEEALEELQHEERLSEREIIQKSLTKLLLEESYLKE